MMVLCLLAGCSGAATTAPTTSSTTKATMSSTSAGKNVNEYGWEIPEKTIEFTYFLAEQADPVKYADNTVHYDEFLKEKFNVIIHRIVYNVDPTERLNLMLATGDYPDAISNVSNDQVALFTAQKKAIDMSPLVDQYGPNIKSQLGDLYIRYFDDNGALYMLPKCWGLLDIPDYTAAIRYDYWKEIGSPEFSTPEEYYDVLVQIQQKHPTNANGQVTYALSDYGGGKKMWQMLTGAWGLKDEYLESSDKTLTHWMNTSQGLEIIKYLNKAYREGQLDPDFAINKIEDLTDKASNHRVMGYIGAWWPSWVIGHMTWQKTDPNWTFDETYINVSFKAESAKAAYLSPKDLTGGARSFITDKAKNAADIMKWWNFEISDIGTKIICLGIPDSDYSDWQFIDGKSIWDDGVIAAMTAGTFDLTEYDAGAICGQYWMVGGQQKLSNGDPLTEPWCTVWFDQNFNSIQPLKKIMHTNLKGTTFDNSYRAVQFTPENPLSVVKTQIDDMLLTGWAQMITCDTEAKCEKTFYDLRDALNKTGLKDIEAFRTTEYQNKLQKWGGK